MDDADRTQEKMEIEESARLAKYRLEPLPVGAKCGCGATIEAQRAAWGLRKCLDCAKTFDRKPRNILGRDHP